MDDKILEQLHNGQWYKPNVKELTELQLKFQDKMFEYNQTKPSELKKRIELLKDMFADFGEGSYLETPFYANWGGYNTHFGKHVYANFNLILVDDTHIYVDDYTQMGPNVTLITAFHPKDPEHRKTGDQMNKPVRIGKNCWLGAGVYVLPGVTIGDNVVVGAGSVVTKDIPSNCLCYGVPAKIVETL